MFFSCVMVLDNYLTCKFNLLEITFLFLASELGDLVESIHLIVGLMENLQGRGTLRVCNCFDMKL